MTHDYAALKQQLEELNAKATAWPWCAFGEHWADDGSYEEPYIFTKPHTDDTIKTICLMRVGLPECGIDNADLIVALRNNLPVILAALEAAQQRDDFEEASKLAHSHLSHQMEVTLARTEDWLQSRQQVQNLTKALKTTESKIKELFGGMESGSAVWGKTQYDKGWCNAVTSALAILRKEALSAIEDES